MILWYVHQFVLLFIFSSYCLSVHIIIQKRVQQLKALAQYKLMCLEGNAEHEVSNINSSIFPQSFCVASFRLDNFRCRTSNSLQIVSYACQGEYKCLKFFSILYIFSNFYPSYELHRLVYYSNRPLKLSLTKHKSAKRLRKNGATNSSQFDTPNVKKSTAKQFLTKHTFDEFHLKCLNISSLC